MVPVPAVAYTAGGCTAVVVVPVPAVACTAGGGTAVGAVELVSGRRMAG